MSEALFTITRKQSGSFSVKYFGLTTTMLSGQKLTKPVRIGS